MPLTLTALTLVGSALSPVQPVDFHLAAPPDRVSVLVAGAAATHGKEAVVDQAAASPPKSPFSTVEGFGHHVPLSFAVRQIVPPAVNVSFGPGVDRSTLVDWQGGQPWNRVLKLAVTPAGLHTLTGHMSVRITMK